MTYDHAYHRPGSLQGKRILVTGGAGFIGSHIVQYLLRHGAERVVALDNLLTGFRSNLEPFRGLPGFELVEGDLSDLATCRAACRGIDLICHQAALGSVPRSVQEPQLTVRHNIDGFVNLAVAARDQGISRIVYASSSSVYGDEAGLPKREERTGNLLSPYAISKWTNELFAQNFARLYGMEFVGLRYFNIFGPRQSPQGPYAAVIPLFVQACLNDQPAYINGDGSQTRDFTFVENAVQANVLALLTDNPEAVNQVYNIGCGGRYSLLQLWEAVCDMVGKRYPPVFRAERPGDIRHSMADISKAQRLLGYAPRIDFYEGLRFLV